ncbi:MAG: SRPBCC domain-containing protein [Gemmatimonadota bacterium]|nr:SRPBCC domain-containing protein [Gemmatimonadota bacterium]
MKETATLHVDVSKRIEARVDTVWGIISTPEGFGAWMGGAVSFTPETGSPFEASFPQFQTVIRGEVLDYDPSAHRLALSWGVASGPQTESLPAGSTRVEVTLEPDGLETIARIVHSDLPSTEETQGHEAGWRFHLSRLALRANRDDLSRHLGASLDAWFAAWNETDADARDALLASCCAEDVVFRDEYADAGGRALLSQHIGNSQHFMPGFEIRVTGPAVVCRGEALVPWEATGPGGLEMSGTNHIAARPDGTITRVTGFQSS